MSRRSGRPSKCSRCKDVIWEVSSAEGSSSRTLRAYSRRRFIFVCFRLPCLLACYVFAMLLLHCFYVSSLAFLFVCGCFARVGVRLHMFVCMHACGCGCGCVRACLCFRVRACCCFFVKTNKQPPVTLAWLYRLNLRLQQKRVAMKTRANF